MPLFTFADPRPVSIYQGIYYYLEDNVGVVGLHCVALGLMGASQPGERAVVGSRVVEREGVGAGAV